MAIFHAVFAERGADAMGSLVVSYDFSRCRVVADLGGASGGLLAAILTANPEARGILENCHAAMASESRLLIIETVLPVRVDATDPLVEKMLMADLNMLAVTGGRERSATAWTSLLSSARFELRRVLSGPGQTSSVLEAILCQ